LLDLLDPVAIINEKVELSQLPNVPAKLDPAFDANVAAGICDVIAELSDREFRVLHHLVRHQGEVVSRERLLSEVWGYHFDPRSNVVDVCVRRLRKKLGEEAPIETVRHGGYRLIPA